MDDVAKYNRKAWDAQVGRGNEWTTPASGEKIASAQSGDVEIVLTPEKRVPDSWLKGLRGSDVLCLAGSGGQQAPILAAAGARITVLDNSPKQLEQDQKTAERYGLELRTVLGDMRDLSVFTDHSFDLIVNPCSVGFVPDVQPVWGECYRVLRPGGSLITGFLNPSALIFDGVLDEGVDLKLRFKLPYSDAESLTDEEKQKLVDADEPFMYSHTLDDLIGGIARAGLSLVDLFEDRWKNRKISDFMPTFIALRAVKPFPGERSNEHSVVQSS